MVYAKRFQVRQSSVLVIVLLLMGSVLYEVTRTESFPWQSSAARTQDISLPADRPAAVKSRFTSRTDYIGTATGAGVRVNAALSDNVLPWAPQAAAVSSRSTALTRAASRGADASFSGALAPRVRSSSGSGYAQGGFGMSGVGAWGGVSGMVRPASTAAARTTTARPARTTRAQTPRRPGGSSGSGGATTDENGLLLANGFSAGAAAAQPGAVATLVPAGSVSPASAPAPTPEPMSLMLVATGLAGVVGARRYFQ